MYTATSGELANWKLSWWPRAAWIGGGWVGLCSVSQGLAGELHNNTNLRSTKGMDGTHPRCRKRRRSVPPSPPGCRPVPACAFRPHGLGLVGFSCRCGSIAVMEHMGTDCRRSSGMRSPPTLHVIGGARPQQCDDHHRQHQAAFKHVHGSDFSCLCAPPRPLLEERRRPIDRPRSCNEGKREGCLLWLWWVVGWMEVAGFATDSERQTRTTFAGPRYKPKKRLPTPISVALRGADSSRPGPRGGDGDDDRARRSRRDHTGGSIVVIIAYRPVPRILAPLQRVNESPAIHAQGPCATFHPRVGVVALRLVGAFVRLWVGSRAPSPGGLLGYHNSLNNKKRRAAGERRSDRAPSPFASRVLPHPSPLLRRAQGVHAGATGACRRECQTTGPVNRTLMDGGNTTFGTHS